MAIVVVAACDDDTPPPKVAADARTATIEASRSAAPDAKPTASATTASQDAAGSAPFRRSPPRSWKDGADAVDECTQVGGSYFSCRSAIDEEKDPLMKRYLLRIAKGYVAGLDGYGSPGTADNPNN